MRRPAAITHGLAAAALLAATAAAAQPVPDPMEALREALPYDVLLRADAAPEEDAAPSQPAAVAAYDPMAAAARPPETAAGSTTAAAHGAPDPELGNLPAGPGAEDTYYQCVACHSTAIIRQQRVTDARWDYLWDWMIEAQGMIEPDEETKDVILGYLKQNFSSER